MWIASEGVVNVPSDGVQRVVSNHLGLFADGLGDPGSCDRSLEESALAGDIYAANTTTDIDGDGRADVCARAANGILCALAIDGGFGPAIPGPELSDAAGWTDLSNYATLRMGDLDGDGRADLCARGDDGVRCWLSLGDGFGPGFDGPAWSDAAGFAAPEYHGTIRVADIDGDGRDDLCVRSASDFRCHASTGSGFGPAILSARPRQRRRLRRGASTRHDPHGRHQRRRPRRRVRAGLRGPALLALPRRRLRPRDRRTAVERRQRLGRFAVLEHDPHGRHRRGRPRGRVCAQRLRLRVSPLGRRRLRSGDRGPRMA